MVGKFSKLELVWRTRKGGDGKTQRDYLDFVVNDQSLSDLLKSGDNIGCLGWLPPESEQIILEQLTTKRLSDLKNNRYSIYICPECADIGCGAITVQIEKDQDGFVWKNFGYENNYDESMRDLESYRAIGDFLFSEPEYLYALTTKPSLITITTMELRVFEANEQKIAEIISDGVVIENTQDALDVMADALAQNAYSIILYEKNLTPDFFDLRTGLAGDILQKHVNYHVKVAIIGEFEKFNSKSLRSFIVESNRGDLVFFVSDRETAIANLTR